MGPTSQIMHRNKMCLMYGPLEDQIHQKGFEEGMFGIASLTDVIYKELSTKLLDQSLSKTTWLTKLPNK